MSETTLDRTLYKLDDNVIAMVRELVQLSLLTGTNIVDHLRSVVVEKHPEDQRFLTLCPEFVESYNSMVTALNKKAEEDMLATQEKLSDDATPSLLD
jgi:hypothetical protein